MKKLISIFTFLAVFQFVFSQSTVETLVRTGVDYHDEGNFRKALDMYKQALAIEPKSSLVHYEMALTYLSLKDYSNAIKHSDAVIKINKLYVKDAYIAKGSALDYSGKTKESVKLFEKAIKRFGDDHLLYYNLGYNYYKLKDLDKAEKALANAIRTEDAHTSSHLLLGFVMHDQKKRPQSLLCLHYFLFLEPNSKRSEVALDLLNTQFKGNVRQDSPNEINIFINAGEKDTDFGAADLMISMMEATRHMDENKDKTEEELFIENTTSFFKMMGELKTDNNKGIWWELYVPVFYSLANSGHMEAYCNWITQLDPISGMWLDDNEEKMLRFIEWLKTIE